MKNGKKRLRVILIVKKKLKPYNIMYGFFMQKTSLDTDTENRTISNDQLTKYVVIKEEDNSLVIGK